MCNIAIDRFITVVKQKSLSQTQVLASISTIALTSLLFALPAPMFSKSLHTWDPATNTTSSKMEVTELGKSRFKVELNSPPNSIISRVI